MIKNIFIFSLMCTAPSLLATLPQACTCLYSNDKDSICYIGSLELSNSDESKQLNLCYDGNIIKVTNGVFCFKGKKEQTKLHLLFINPELVHLNNDGETITGLELQKDAPYHLYRLKKIATKTLKKEPTIKWNIKKKTMPIKIVKNATHHLVPDHTLIIPLDATFFKQDNDEITFSYQPLVGRTSVVKLPTPTYAANKNLKDALLHAHLCMMNLKIFHAPQEVKKIRLDNHQLILEGL